MSCDPKTFAHVDTAVFEGLQSKLQGLGYNIQGTSGTISGPMGIVIDFSWDKAAASLLIHVKEKNFLVPCSRIYAELEKAIEACRA